MPHPTSIQAALDRLRQRLEAERHLQESLPNVEASRKKPRSTLSEQNLEEGEKHAREMAEFVRSLRDSGRTSYANYVCSVDFWIGVQIHEGRLLAGKYTELESVAERLSAVEREHGLKPGETRFRDEGPDEWIALNRQYEQIIDSKFVPTLREFGFDDLADLFEKDPSRYHQLAEIGRRAMFEEPPPEARLQQLESRYRNEADAAEASGAYYAAAAMRGAALEAALLRMALDRRAEVDGARAQLESELRPQSSDPLRWGLARISHALFRSRSETVPAAPSTG